MNLLHRVHRIADRHHGIVTVAELQQLGLSRPAIGRLVERGVVLRVHRGILKVRGSPDTLQQRAIAASLACGTGAVLSDRTSAELWKLIPVGDGPIHITVPQRRKPERAGVIVHRRELGPHEVTRLGPIPITRPARTIADLDKALREPALDEALRRGLVRPDQLLGHDRHLDVLTNDRLTHGVPESELERRAIVLFKRRRLPQPVRQFPVGRYRIDLAYPDAMLAIELDGREHHLTRERWRDDLRRQNELELAGWRMLRFTWMDVSERPDETVEQIRRALSAARSPLRAARPGRPGAR